MAETEQFAAEERVLEWSPSEVCYWLKTISFGIYIECFFSAQIFGDVLLQDIGKRMLCKLKVSTMHCPKLLREIATLRQAAIEKGVDITLSPEIVREMEPQKESKKKKKSRKGRGGRKGNAQRIQEMERQCAAERERYAELERSSNEREEQLRDEFNDEKDVRIGLELELEQLKADFEALRSTGSKAEVEKLQNLISNVEESKIRTVRDLNEQLNSLRIACRLMQRETNYWKNRAGFHPIDSLVASLGYAQPHNY